jgi:hypothetical protein
VFPIVPHNTELNGTPPAILYTALRSALLYCHVRRKVRPHPESQGFLFEVLLATKPFFYVDGFVERQKG